MRKHPKDLNQAAVAHHKLILVVQVRGFTWYRLVLGENQNHSFHNKNPWHVRLCSTRPSPWRPSKGPCGARNNSQVSNKEQWSGHFQGFPQLHELKCESLGGKKRKTLAARSVVLLFAECSHTRTSTSTTATATKETAEAVVIPQFWGMITSLDILQSQGGQSRCRDP